MINAEIICDTMNYMGDRLTTMILTFPRYILAEFNTHRILSKNSASSRAIPFHKMLKMVKENPFIPVAYQRDHQGMQGTEYFTLPVEVDSLNKNWLLSRDFAIQEAENLAACRVTKQLCNRLLEPFMWHRVLVTGSHWDNFFNLRSPQYRYEPENILYKSRLEYMEKWRECFGDNPPGLEYDLDWLQLNEGKADIHMMLLAEKMYQVYEHSPDPIELKEGEWHLPFSENLETMNVVNAMEDAALKGIIKLPATVPETMIKIATARCARVSYDNFEGDSNDYVKDLDLFSSLLIRPYKNLKGITFSSDDPIHASPAEHCSQAMGERNYKQFAKYEFGKSELGWCRNFQGFIQLRALLEHGIFS